MKDIKEMTALEKAEIELELWQYFCEFSGEGVSPTIFKERQETPGENGDIYLSNPEYNKNREVGFFEKFFLMKKNQSTFSTNRFIEHEKIVVKEKFNELTKSSEFPIILNWIEHLDEQLKLSSNDTVQPEPHREEKKEIFSFNNNFDSIDSKDVYNHFYNNLVKTKMFSDNDLKEYLKQAFELKEIPNKLFELENVKSKQKVIRIFYEYFKVTNGKPQGKQKYYAELLGEYFHGYKTKNVRTNFSK